MKTLDQGVRGWAVLLLLLMGSFAPVVAGDPAKDQSPEGHWMGVLRDGQVLLRFSIHVKKQMDGKQVGTIDSVDQNVQGIPLSSVVFAEERMRFSVLAWGASFDGKWTTDPVMVDGNWKQSGKTFPVKWTHSKEPFDFSRPQDPKKPYPYHVEEISFVNQQAKIKLAGTLTKPKGPGPFPAVVLIPGSAPADRDYSANWHKYFLVLADHLTRRGIAVVRYDVRGVGKSTGKAFGNTTDERAADALAAVEFLKNRKDIHPKQIGLVGHSEGGIIAPMLAVKSADVGFIVLLAPSCLPGEELLLLQKAAIAKAEGADDAGVAFITEWHKTRIKAYQEEPDDNLLAKKLVALAKEAALKLPEKDRAGFVQRTESTAPSLRWERHFLKQDPRPMLTKIPCPVLVLAGTKDPITPSRQNLAEAEKSLQAGGNKDFTLKEFPNLNHTFQTCNVGTDRECYDLQETLAPAALALVATWIRQRTGPALAIDQVQLTHGPLGPKRASASFVPGDEIYFRFTATGVKTDSDGQSDLELQIQLQDSQGKSVLDHKEAVKKMVHHLGGAALTLTPSVNFAVGFAPGDYQAIITLRDRLGKGSASFERKITCRKSEFAVARLRLSHDKDGNIPAAARGTVGQQLHCSFWAVGFERAKKIHVTSTVQTLDREGNELMPSPVRLFFSENDPEKVGKLQSVLFNARLELHRPGEYRLRITVTDEVSKKKAVFETPLTVTSP